MVSEAGISGLSHIPIGRSRMGHRSGPESAKEWVLTLETFVVNMSAASGALINMKGKWPYPNGVSSIKSTKGLDRTRRSGELQNLCGREGEKFVHLQGEKYRNSHNPTGTSIME